MFFGIFTSAVTKFAEIGSFRSVFAPKVQVLLPAKIGVFLQNILDGMFRVAKFCQCRAGIK